MQPGNHTVQIEDYGVTRLPSTGDPQVFVKFKNAANETMLWYGGLNTKVNEGKKYSQADITLKNLATLGFKGGINDIVELYDGRQSMKLNGLMDFEIVVENNTYNNVTSPRIKYINIPGEGGTGGKPFESKAALMQALAKAQTATSAQAPAARDYLK